MISRKNYFLITLITVNYNNVPLATFSVNDKYLPLIEWFNISNDDNENESCDVHKKITVVCR